jgi:uncharacterized tellurite resistance protein B-like protein
MASKRQRSLALLKVLAAAAWADGQLDHDEINHMKELMLVYDLGPEEMREIDMLLEAPVSYVRCEDLTRDLLGMLNSQAEREEALAEVKALLQADGQFTEEERDVMAGLQGIMNAMTSVDRFMAKISGVFRRTFASRDWGAPPGELSLYLKNTVLQRLHDLSEGGWRDKIEAQTLNRYTLFGAVLGRVADVKDGISLQELDTVREILSHRFGLEPPLLDWVIQAVNEAASARMNRQGLLSEFNRISDSGERKELLDAAFAVAAADGAVSNEELEELRLISNFLWIDPRDFNEIRTRWTQNRA